MQQRRLRLGDILDDYCPRERRITNHAVVAMIEDEVKQTRCTTCDADHEYKQARVPLARRKKADGVLADAPEGALRRPVSDSAAPADDETPEIEAPVAEAGAEEPAEAPPAEAEMSEPSAVPIAAGAADDAAPGEDAAPGDDEGPVHRRLIRATLPRPEGQVPERKAPDFTIRQPGGRGGREFDGNKNGHRHGGGRRPMRVPGGSGSGQPPRFGGPRQGPGSGQGGPRHGSGQGQRQPGNRPGQPGGQRGGGRPGQGGQGRGGGGRKRGR